VLPDDITFCLNDACVCRLHCISFHGYRSLERAHNVVERASCDLSARVRLITDTSTAWYHFRRQGKGHRPTHTEHLWQEIRHRPHGQMNATRQPLPWYPTLRPRAFYYTWPSVLNENGTQNNEETTNWNELSQCTRPNESHECGSSSSDSTIRDVLYGAGEVKRSRDTNTKQNNAMGTRRRRGWLRYKSTTVTEPIQPTVKYRSYHADGSSLGRVSTAFVSKWVSRFI